MICCNFLYLVYSLCMTAIKPKQSFPRFMCVCVCQVSAKQFVASRERDFFRWLKLPIPIYKCEVPVKTDASKSSQLNGRGNASISVVLPSDHLQALYDQGPDASCHQHLQCTHASCFDFCFSFFSILFFHVLNCRLTFFR